jgi:hypothetical protein
MSNVQELKRDIGDAICEALVSGATRNAELVKEVGLLRLALAKIRAVAIGEPSYVNAIKIEVLANDALRGKQISSPATGVTQELDASSVAEERLTRGEREHEHRKG